MKKWVIAFLNFFWVMTSFAGVRTQHENPHLLVYKNNTVHLYAHFIETPEVGRESVMVLQFKDASTGESVMLHDQVTVNLWMPSMGHGSSPTEVEPVRDAGGKIMAGVFRVTQVYFIMSGEWEVQITLANPHGYEETQAMMINLD